MKKWTLVAILLAVLAGAAIYPKTRRAGMALAGQGNGCTFWKSFEIEQHQKALTESKDRILAASKLLSKDERGLEQYSTPYGMFWAPAGSRFILPFNLAEEEVGIYGKGDQGVRKGDVVLDCGANVGTFARFALNAGARTVVAIEPAPDNLECLRRNFPAEIADGRMILVPKGVWDKEDTLELLVDPQNQAADSFVIHREGAKAIAKVPLTTIDHLVDDLKLDKVSFVKMDIEGAEVKAVRGARQTIARFRPRMALSAYHQEDHPREIPKAVKEGWTGYTVECGPCNKTDHGIRADVLYFH